METFFGLDFGTSNSALSVNTNGEVRLLNIDKFNLIGKTMRSILFFDKNSNAFVGQEAINKYLENSAEGRLMQSIKSFLPHKSFTQTNICGKKYELEDLLTIVIKHIKEAGEESIGFKVESVVMGRPVVFSEDAEDDVLAQKRLETAAKRAGFKKIAFQLEPIAAALSFESALKNKKEQNVFVGDFGGGTSDFAVIKLRGAGSNKTEDRKNDVLAVGGVYVAGDAFDSQIMWEKVTPYFGRGAKHKSSSGDWLDMPIWIMRILCKWHLIPSLRDEEVRNDINKVKLTTDSPQAIKNLEDLIDKNFGLMIFQAIEEAKLELSSKNESEIFYNNNSLHIKEAIAKPEFEKIISEDVYKIKECMASTLLASGLSAKEIDLVFITGGTSNIPCIKDMLIKKFGADKIRETDAFTSVAYGLGLSSYLL